MLFVLSFSTMSSLRLVCSLLVLACATSGLVQFSKSALYDVYDFQESNEVPLTNCDNGCLIFASTTDEYKGSYMNNLIVRDASGKEKTIAAIAKQVQGKTSLKLPYEITGKGSIINRNAAGAEASDVSVYVVDRTKARSVDFEIYDAASMVRSSIAPKSVITILAARRFAVNAEKGQANSFTARLTGFDNAQENNVDNCVHAYKTQKFEGFEFHVDGPIVSLVFDKMTPVTIKSSYEYRKFPYHFYYLDRAQFQFYSTSTLNADTVRDLSKAGFISTPGFHGCANVDALQVFRQWNGGFFGGEFDLNSTDKLRVTWEIDTDVSEQIVFKDMTNNKRTTVNGVKKNFPIVMEGTQFVSSYYNDASPPHGFIARHTGIRV